MSLGSRHRLRHIVVVDDEEATREVVGDYLRINGFEVTLCDGGRSLRSLLRGSRKPDLIVLDLNMPEEDGLSILRYVKETHPVPVILLTATASPIDRVIGLEMGADDYLAKPCELRELMARINAVLGRSLWSTRQRPERRLAAIVSFDQVGFSSFVQRDEQLTLAAVEAIFTQIIAPSLAAYRGTLFKMLGDGALMEFSSIVDAVEWGIEVQTVLAESALTQLSIGTVRFRLGIAVGDVLINQSDRSGEGVALAVRIQEVARPGTVTLSDYAHQFVMGKIPQDFDNRGTVVLKNIAVPMRIWEWAPAPAGAAPGA